MDRPGDLVARDRAAGVHLLIVVWRTKDSARFAAAGADDAIQVVVLGPVAARNVRPPVGCGSKSSSRAHPDHHRLLRRRAARVPAGMMQFVMATAMVRIVGRSAHDKPRSTGQRQALAPPRGEHPTAANLASSTTVCAPSPNPQPVYNLEFNAKMVARASPSKAERQSSDEPEESNSLLQPSTDHKPRARVAKATNSRPRTSRCCSTRRFRR